jgi:chromosome segregation ATPase
LPPNELAQATKTVYHRRIREYATELRELSEKRALLQTALAGLEADNQRLVEAAASAERLTAFRQDRIAKLTSDISGLTRDREAVNRLATLVQQQLDTIQRLLDETLRDNSQLVRQLAAIQTAAATPPPQSAGPAPEPTSLGRAN